VAQLTEEAERPIGRFLADDVERRARYEPQGPDR
jgi:hypothetical protein